MDYKEKYEQALEVAQRFYNNSVAITKKGLEDIFPELKESEDEKTKEEIINYLECQSRDEPSRKDTHNKWISYIEKYALSKDNYGFLRDCARVLKTFGWQSYADRLTGLCPASGEAAKAMMSTPIIFDESEDERIRKMVLKAFKLFAEKQAWVGHCLDDIDWDKCIAWLEKQDEQKPAVVPKFRVGDIIKNKKTKDAVKVNGVDLQNQAYYYQGWDGAATVHSDFKISEQDDWELVEQKPEWSIDDAWNMQVFINALELYNNPVDKVLLKSWIKSLKDRCHPQQMAEWSEEDKIIRMNIIDYISSSDIDKMAKYSWLSWLRSLLFKKPYKGCVNFINGRCEAGGVSQKQWKPSDEQMELLREVQQALLGKDCHNRFTNFMYELKRLMEE